MDAKPGQELLFGAFRLDRADERLLGPQGPVKLGNKAYQVLLTLAEHEGRLVTKDALFDTVWDGTIVSESALTSVIKELRRALGDDTRTPRYIESVYGRGYRLLTEIRHPPAPDGIEPGGGAPAAVSAAETARPPLILVEAFDDATVREAHPYLAATLREEILLALSRFRDISLVSAPDGAPPSPPLAHGPRDYRLALRLVSYGAAVRAFARLSRPDGQAIIWADQVELAAESLGADVDRLIRNIVSAALPRMHDDLLGHLPPQPSDIYDAYFLAKLRMRSLATFAEAQAVAEDWERLIAANPGFGPAYPPLTRLYNTDYCYTGVGSTGPNERRRAYELAHRVVALDPTESHFHTVKGWAHLRAGEPVLAREHLDEALRLNPYNQPRLLELATAYLYLDDLDRAAALLDRHRGLAAFATAVPHEELGILHLLRGEFDAAMAQLTLVRRYHPEDSAGMRPTVVAELFALLAATGAQSADVAERAERWRAMMTERWHGAEPISDRHLLDWLDFHAPFQNPERKARILALLETALSGRTAARSRIQPQGPSGSGSSPSRAGFPSGSRTQPRPS